MKRLLSNRDLKTGSRTNYQVKELGLRKHADVFAENEIAFDALKRLTYDDLNKHSLQLGSRKIVATAIAKQFPSSSSPTAKESSKSPKSYRLLRINGRTK